MNELCNIPISSIDVGERLRGIDPDQVASIRASVDEIGLLNPITVYPREERFGLVAGAHRLEVYRQIGHDEIPAHIIDLSDLERQIAECDENLCATVLTPTEKAIFTKRRKDAYEALHPEVRHGGDRKSDQVDNLSTRSFAADTAEKTGVDARTVRRDAERGEKVSSAAMAFIKNTPLDTGAYLDKLKRLPESEQIHAARRDLAQRNNQEKPKAQSSSEQRGGIASRYAQAPVPTGPTPTEAYEQFVQSVDRIEALPVAAIVAGAGRHKSVLNQRASGLIDLLHDIMGKADQ